MTHTFAGDYISKMSKEGQNHQQFMATCGLFVVFFKQCCVLIVRLTISWNLYYYLNIDI